MSVNNEVAGRKVTSSEEQVSDAADNGIGDILADLEKLLLSAETREWLKTLVRESGRFLDSQLGTLLRENLQRFLQDQLGVALELTETGIVLRHVESAPTTSASVAQIRKAAEQVIPPTATVLVVSEGDDALLTLGDRRAWHFPQDENRRYLGRDPLDDHEAVERLDALRAQGGTFLVIPSSARWWLDHYAKLRDRLEKSCRGIIWQDDACLIFDLHDGEHVSVGHQLRDVVNRVLTPVASLIVLSLGHEDWLVLDGRQTWHFPRKEDGSHAGVEPVPVDELIAHLETLRGQGAHYFLVPTPALSWLERHPDFRRYLEDRYVGVVCEEGACLIFSLDPKPTEEETAEYQHMLYQVRRAVHRTLPLNATVTVLSEGNADILRLGGRSAWHFREQADGELGGYPEDSAGAIAMLEAQRAKGSDFFLIPPFSQWWFEKYEGFRDYLEEHFAPVVRHCYGARDVITIYSLHRLPRDSKTLKPFGVNITGHIGSEKGSGEAVRATIRCLEAAHIPYAVHHYQDQDAVNPDASFRKSTKENPYSINLIQLNADTAPEFMDIVGKEYLKDRYNIGYWFWELSDFPREWQSSFFGFDEIWVGSNHGLDALSRAAPVPVVRVPVAIPEQLELSDSSRGDLGLPDDHFVFLFIFDFMSVTERKNPLGLIQAFKNAFSRKDKALLVLKGSHADRAPESFRQISRAAQGANIKIMDAVLSRPDINRLADLSDCYVSLHRSEGFGLTMAEAMSLEKPVIATAYSGNIDFMTPANSFLVKYRLVELERDFPPYRKGCVWADPDLDHAAEQMCQVFENRELAKEIGRQAREDILKLLHPSVVGRLIKERFLRISQSGKAPLALPLNGHAPAPQQQPVFRRKERVRLRSPAV
jgi:glycosyltransferase involved in cell wall biosynthesis